MSLIPINAVGDAQTVRTPKFGFAAMRLEGQGSTVQAGPHDDFNFDADDWTVDFWVKVLDAEKAHLCCFAAVKDGAPDPDNFFTIEKVTRLGGAVRLRVRYRLAGEDLVTLEHGQGAHLAMEGSWVHIALVRSTTTLTMWTGGTSYAVGNAQTVELTPLTMDFSDWVLHIGGAFEGSTFRTAHALFDEFRVSREAEWTAPFTPPGSAYTRTFDCEIVGRGHLRRSTEQEIRGGTNVVVRNFETEVGGAHDVLHTFETVVRGTALLLTSHEATVRGGTNVISLGVEASVGGASIVRNGFETEVRGSGQRYTTADQYETEVRGASHVLNQFEGELRGGNQVLESIEAEVAGRHRIAGLAAEIYELYYGDGSEPDFTAAPAATSTTLPMLSPVITGAGLHYFVIRKVNRYGVRSQNVISTVIELDGADEQILLAPTVPESCISIAYETDEIQVAADYAYGVDADPADQFTVYTKIGIGGSWELQDTIDMVRSDGIARLVWVSSQSFGLDFVIARVHAKRSSDGREGPGKVSNLVNFLTAVPVDPVELVFGEPI